MVLLPKRVALCALAGLLLMASAASAQMVRVWTVDRSTPIRGELISESPDAIVLQIAGINTTITRDKIDQIQYEKTMMDEYRERRAALGPGDDQGRYDLAKWLFDKRDREADQLALRELNTLLQGNPDHEQGKLLKVLVQQRVDRTGQGRPTPPTTTTTTPRPTTTAAQPRTPAERHADTLLTPTQRNAIKVMEIDLLSQPRVVVPVQALTDFHTKFSGTDAMEGFRDRDGLNRLRRLQGYEQLGVIFNARAREFYDQVLVRTEPQPLQMFRSRINPQYVSGYLVRTFGQTPVPGLYLHAHNATREDVAYTNFYNLHMASHLGLLFIDRNIPEESLLLQWGLPRESAKHPAPDVANWRPYFTGTDDPKYTQMLDWVSSLYTTADYPIELAPPPAPAPVTAKAGAETPQTSPADPATPPKTTKDDLTPTGKTP